MRFVKKKYSVPYRREIFVCVGFATSFFLLIAVLTFSAHDPSWFYYTTSDGVVTNKCGFFGAQCAALLMYLFGAASLLVPFLIALCSSLLFLKASWRHE